MKPTLGVLLVVIALALAAVAVRTHRAATERGAPVPDASRPPDPAAPVPRPVEAPVADEVERRVAFASSGLAPSDMGSFFDARPAEPEGDCALFGRVVDDLGAPLEAFHLEARTTRATDPWGYEVADESFEDAEGEFRLDGLIASDWRVVVYSGFTGDWQQRIPPRDLVALRMSDPIDVTLADAQEMELEFVVPRRGWIDGTVIDDRGRPIRAELTAQVETAHFPYDNADWSRVGPTGDDGAFSMPLRAGVAYVFARADGFAASGVAVRPIAPGGRTEVVLELRRGTTIEVELRDSDGHPVAGREVYVTEDEYLYCEVATTDATGLAIFENAVPGRYRADVSEERSYESLDGLEEVTGTERVCSKSFRIAAGDAVTKVELALPVSREVRLSGSMRDLPIPCEDVDFYEVEGGRWAPAFLDEDGTYNATLPAPGRYEMRVDFAHGAHSERVVDVPDATAFRYDVAFEAGTVSGRVVDAQNKPIAGVELEACTVATESTRSRGSTESDADGAFRLHLVAGTYQLAADATDAGYVQVELDGVTVGSGTHIEGVDVQLRRGGTVTGRLVDASGEPLRNGFVTVFGPGRVGARADGAGHFELTGVPPGRIRLHGYAHDIGITHTGTLEVDVSVDQTTDVEFRLDETRPVYVRVRNQSGELVEAEVTVPPADSPDRRGWFREGVHQVGPLPFGAYRARIEFDGQVREVDFVVEAERSEVFVDVAFD